VEEIPIANPFFKTVSVTASLKLKLASLLYSSFSNELGKSLTGFKYDDIYDFINGLALVMLDKKYGYIDSNGKEVIPVKYNWCSHNWQPLIPVKLGKQYGCLDRKGRVVIPIIYDSSPKVTKEKIEFRKDYKTFIYNQKGELISSE